MKDKTSPLPNRDEPAGLLFTGLYFRIALAIIAAHSIVVYGEPESVFSMMLGRDYHIAVAGSAVIAYLLIAYDVHRVDKMPDRRLPWEGGQVVARLGYRCWLPVAGLFTGGPVFPDKGCQHPGNLLPAL